MNVSVPHFYWRIFNNKLVKVYENNPFHKFKKKLITSFIRFVNVKKTENDVLS